MSKVVNNGRPRCLAFGELLERASGWAAKLNRQAEPSQRLREMGFHKSAVVQKIAGGHLLICQPCGARAAPTKRMARNIVVEPIYGDA